MAGFDLLNGTPTAPGETEFDDWLLERNQKSALRATTALTAARTVSTPEEVTRRRTVAATAGLVLGTNVPAKLLTDTGMLEMVENKIISTRSFETLKKNPALAAWFSDQDNAAIASTNVEELGLLSQVFNGVARGADKFYDDMFGPGSTVRTSTEVLQRARDSQETFTTLLEQEKEGQSTGALSDARRDALVKLQKDQGPGYSGAVPFDPSTDTEGANPFTTARAAKRWLDSRIYGLTSFSGAEEDIPKLEGVAAEGLRDLQREETQRQKDFPIGRGAAEVSRMISEMPADAGFFESTKMLASIVADRPGDFVGFLAGTAAESGISLIAAAGVTAVTKNPIAARAAMFGTAVPVVRASNTLELAAAKGYDLTKPADARRLAENPTDLNDLIDSVGVYSTVVSLVDATTAGLGSAMIKSPVGSFVFEAVSQAVAGGGGEILARMVSGQQWNWTEAILEGLAEMITAPLEAAGIGSEVVFRKHREAQKASDRKQFFTALSTGAKASELRARSPEAYKSAVEALTKDGPVENVYVDAGRMEQLFQDAPDQLQKLFDAVPELDYRAFQKAAETGSVFAIPTAVYAASIAGTDIDARLTDNLRLRPDRLSYAEAQEAMAETEAELQGFATRIKELEATAELDPAAQREYEDLVSQLVVAGRAPGVARAEAQLLASTVQTMAQRQGITTAEFVRRNIVPTIRRDGPVTQSPVRVMRMNDLSEALVDPARAIMPEFAAIVDELAEQNLTPETATEDDIRLAAIAVADKGGLVSNLDEEFLLTPSGIYRATPGETMMQTVSLRNGTEDLSAYGHTPGKKIGTRALALIMEKRQRALYGKISRTSRTPKTIEKMANWMADEIEFELQTPGAAADGWYTTKFQKALDIMAARFPELDTKADFVPSNLPGLAKITSAYEARQLMTMIIAVTSNGAKVQDNYRMAVDAYEQLRETGSVEQFTGISDRGSSTSGHLNLIVDMLAQFDTFAEMSGYLLEDITVSELNKELKKAGAATLTKMPSTARVPRAAAVFGPKLGAFMANLSGADGYLTMDLWWTRTINRYRGDVLPRVSGLKNAVNSKGEPIGLHRFKWMIGQPDLTDSQALKLTIDYAQRYKDKKYKNGTEAEQAANTIYKAAFVKLDEAPGGAADRGFMIEVAAAAREELYNRTGKRYSIADVQALIWYYEKRLMADMGAKASGDISYEEAAQRAISGPDRVSADGTDAGTGQVDGDAVSGTVPGDRGSRTGDEADGDVREVSGAAGQPPLGVTPSYADTFYQPGSDAFKAWFGDSVVVDEQGEPLLVKHGTRFGEPIDVFMPMTHFGTATAANQRLDIDERFDNVDDVNSALPQGRVYPVYLAMSNPLPIGREQGFSDSDGWVDDADMIRQIGAVLNRIARDKDDAAHARVAAKMQTLSELAHDGQVEPEEARTEAAELLESLGYDGLSYTNIIEDAGSTSYVPARATQIKSAFNSGTFDPSNPSIMFQGVPGARFDDVATPADFEGELKLSTFRKKGWFVVSATQSHFGDWNSPENMAEADRMRKWLADSKLDYREVQGIYAGTPDGPSFLVFGNETTMGQTARSMFRQESILTRQGLVYSPYEERKPVAITGLRIGEALKPEEDYQTTLPSGETFTLDLDWPDPKSDDPRDDLFKREDGLTELVHWSPKERATIDPKHAGKGGMDGPERHRSGPKKAFFGLNQGKRNTAYKRESTALGGLKHTVAVDPAKLYPWDTDPDGLREKINGKLPAVQQIGAYETAIKKAGYVGYFVIDGPLGDVAAVFDALPVEKVEVDNALYQSDEAYFKSALSQAILEAKQETAPAQDWLKIIPKLPGVKKAELEWTGLTAWLEGQEPTRKLTRQHIYHWLSSQQVQIEVVDGPGTFESYKTDLSGATAYEEILITVPNLDEIGPNAGKEISSAVANSGHFDTPNIVVHARVQRTGDTLFIDEIQSDLNSFWRKRGGQAQALAPVSDEVRAEVEAYNAVQRRWDDAGDAMRAARERVGDAARDFGFLDISVFTRDVYNAMFSSSRTLENLSRASSVEAFDTMLGTFISRQVPRLAASAIDDRLVGQAARGAANGDLIELVREAIRLEQVAREAQAAVRLARDQMTREARDLYEGIGDNELPLPLSPFEGESAIQLAMKYLTTYAAREGFKKIAWTPGYMQMKRWGVQEQRAQGMVEAYMTLNAGVNSKDPSRGAHRVVSLRLEGQRTASFTVDASGQVTDVGLGFPPELIRDRNIREILPQALAERIMRPFPEGETMVSEEASDFPEVNLSDNAGQGYRIVYDQQMKRFLEKWAGKFGAKVESDTSLVGSGGGSLRQARDFLNDQTVTEAYFNQAVRNSGIDDTAALVLMQDFANPVGDPRTAWEQFLRLISVTRTLELANALGYKPPSDPVWALELTDEFRAEATKPQPLFQNRPNGARGQIILPPAGSDAAPEITVFDRADLSTVIHEGGHWMLWLLQTGSQAGDPFSTEATQAVNAWFASQAEDIAKEMGLIAPQVLEYLANGTTGAADVDAAVHRGLHERFARGFEAYMREGKAPSIALKGVFHRFAAWLMEVYKSAVKLRVELNDEVRQVFDKMIATDAQIAQARQLSVGAEQIAATAKAMGLDEASYEELVRLQDEERAEAFGLAMREALAPIMAQRSAEMRALRSELTTQISAEVNAQKHNRAYEWLANGRWLGTGEQPVDLPADLRMDPETLIDDYDQATLDRLPRGRRPMTRIGGLSADETAGWFGYNSGAELIEDLISKPRARDEIKQRVQAALAEHIEAQDPREAAAQTEALVDALHGEKHGQVLAAELRAINRVSTRKKGTITSRQQAAQIARDIIARTPAREAIRSDLYAQQARTYAEQATRAMATGDTDAAFEAKRRQLIQHSLYVESRKAAELVARIEKKAAKLKRSGTRKNLAGEYLEAIDDILYTYDFRKMSAAAEKKRGGLLRYIEMMAKAGRENELAIPDHLISNANRVPYKTLSIQRLQGVLDALSNIEHTARLKKKLLDRQRERDMDAVVGDIVDAFDANIKGRDMSRVPTGFERVRDAVKEYVNYATNADTILRRIDGWVTGAVYKHLKSGIDRASSEEVVMRLRASAELDKLFAVYGRGERRRMAVRRMWNGYDQSLSKWDLISVALNSGNKDNWERMTSRDNPQAISAVQAKELLTNLDERDWKFVQSIWDHLDAEYWPQIAAREKRTTGVVPKKVEAMLMVPTPVAGVTGGYYPIVYDRRFSAKVAEEKHQEIQNAMQAGRFGKAQTRNGHTKERAAGSGGRTVELGIHVLFGHVNQVIHDLALSEEVANGWKIMQDPRVRGLFEKAGLLNDLASLEIWLQDVAAGQVVAGGVLGRMARHAKSGFTVSKLAFNMSTVAIQFTGLAQSMAVIGKRQMVKSYSSYVAQGVYPAAQRIKARSTFMAERERTFQRDIFDLVGEATNTPVSGGFADAKALLMSAGFWAMQKVQFYVVDAPTWMAGYEKARKQGATDDEAVEIADRAVARAQASGVYADRTPIERGTLGRDTRQNEFLRLFTALGSYMFAKFNVAQEIAGRTRRDVAAPDKSSIAAVLNGTIDMLLIFTVEAVLYNMIKGTLPGDDDEDEQSWLAFLAAETALSAMGTLPFIRDMSSVLQGFDGGGAYGGVLETLGKPLVQIGEGEVDKQFMRSMNDLLGLAVPGYPSTAIWRMADAEMTRQTGEEVSPLAYIMGLPR